MFAQLKWTVFVVTKALFFPSNLCSGYVDISIFIFFGSPKVHKKKQVAEEAMIVYCSA